MANRINKTQNMIYLIQLCYLFSAGNYSCSHPTIHCSNQKSNQFSLFSLSLSLCLRFSLFSWWRQLNHNCSRTLYTKHRQPRKKWTTCGAIRVIRWKMVICASKTSPPTTQRLWKSAKTTSWRAWCRNSRTRRAQKMQRPVRVCGHWNENVQRIVNRVVLWLANEPNCMHAHHVVVHRIATRAKRAQTHQRVHQQLPSSYSVCWHSHFHRIDVKSYDCTIVENVVRFVGDRKRP